MIYTNFTNTLVTRDYRVFCLMMRIPFGAGSERSRTPAESRTVNQFLLSLNKGRRSVYLNFNESLAVIVEGSSDGEENYSDFYYAPAKAKRMLERHRILKSTFEGPSKILRNRFLTTLFDLGVQLRKEEDAERPSPTKVVEALIPPGGFDDPDWINKIVWKVRGSEE